MLRLRLYDAASAGPDLDEFFKSIVFAAFENPGTTRFDSSGPISLDPDNPYPKNHTVTATYLGTGFEYLKQTTHIIIGSGLSSNFSTWSFQSGLISSVRLELDGQPLLSERFDTPYFAQVLPADVGSVALGVNFTGNNHANIFDGGNVRDVLRGLGGDDILWGKGGKDSLLGGNGSDRLNGGGGADLMAGGNGHDSYRVDAAGDRVVESAGEGRDLVVASVSYGLALNVENLALTGNAVTATGNPLANVLTGTAADNLLDGRAGNDTLIGGVGSDWLVGAGGVDTFLFSHLLHSLPGAAADVIADFETGIDTIDLSRLGASLTFIGRGAFSGTAGEVHYANHVVAVDINGDATLDFEIRIKGVVALSADDFQL